MTPVSQDHRSLPGRSPGPTVRWYKCGKPAITDYSWAKSSDLGEVADRRTIRSSISSIATGDWAEPSAMCVQNAKREVKCKRVLRTIEIEIEEMLDGAQPVPQRVAVHVQASGGLHGV